MKRPRLVSSQTHAVQTGCGQLYVILGTYKGRLLEVFLVTGNADESADQGERAQCMRAQCEALGRMLSLALRCRVDPAEIVDQLASIRCDKQRGLGPAAVLSCADGISRVIKGVLSPEG